MRITEPSAGRVPDFFAFSNHFRSVSGSGACGAHHVISSSGLSFAKLC